MSETSPEDEGHVNGVEEGFEMTPTAAQGTTHPAEDEQEEELEMEHGEEGDGVEVEEEEEVETKDETHGSSDVVEDNTMTEVDAAEGAQGDQTVEMQEESAAGPGGSTPKAGSVGGVGKVLNSGIFGGESSLRLST